MVEACEGCAQVAVGGWVLADSVLSSATENTSVLSSTTENNRHHPGGEKGVRAWHG